MAKQTEDDIEIVPSMMAKIELMDECDKAVLLGEDPDTRPQVEPFRKALRKIMPLKDNFIETGRDDVAEFLQLAADHDLRFQQAWLIYQKLTYEKP